MDTSENSTETPKQQKIIDFIRVNSTIIFIFMQIYDDV